MLAAGLRELQPCAFLSHSRRAAVPGQLRESESTEATDLLGSQPLRDISTFRAPSVRDNRGGIRPHALWKGMTKAARTLQPRAGENHTKARGDKDTQQTGVG